MLSERIRSRLGMALSLDTLKSNISQVLKKNNARIVLDYSRPNPVLALDIEGERETICTMDRKTKQVSRYVLPYLHNFVWNAICEYAKQEELFLSMAFTRYRDSVGIKLLAQSHEFKEAVIVLLECPRNTVLIRSKL